MNNVETEEQQEQPPQPQEQQEDEEPLQEGTNIESQEENGGKTTVTAATTTTAATVSSRRQNVKHRQGTGRETQRRKGVEDQTTLGRRTGQNIKTNTLTDDTDDELGNLPGQFFASNKPTTTASVFPLPSASFISELNDRSDLTVLTSATSTTVMTGYESNASLTSEGSDAVNRRVSPISTSDFSGAEERIISPISVEGGKRKSGKSSDSATNRNVVSMELATSDSDSAARASLPNKATSALDKGTPGYKNSRQSTIPRGVAVSPLSNINESYAVNDSLFGIAEALKTPNIQKRSRPADVEVEMQSKRQRKESENIQPASSRRTLVLSEEEDSDVAKPSPIGANIRATEDDFQYNEAGGYSDNEEEAYNQRGTSEEEVTEELQRRKDKAKDKVKAKRIREGRAIESSADEDNLYEESDKALEEEEEELVDDEYGVDLTTDQETIRSQERESRKDKTFAATSEEELQSTEEEEEEEEGDDQARKRGLHYNRAEVSLKVGKYMLRPKRVRSKPVEFWKCERIKPIPDFDRKGKPIFREHVSKINEGVGELADSSIVTRKKRGGAEKHVTRLEQLVIDRKGMFPVKSLEDPETQTPMEIARTKDMNPQKSIRFNQETKERESPGAESAVDMTISFGLSNDVYRVGKCTIHPGCTKPSSNSKNYFETFYILSGMVTVRVNDSEFHLSPGGHFMVPPKNTYSISNRSGVKDAEVFFVVGQYSGAAKEQPAQGNHTLMEE